MSLASMSWLSMDQWSSIQFHSLQGLGRIALVAFGIGSWLTFHICLLLWNLGFANELNNGILQWSVYAIILGFFHFSEFITTAQFKPESLNYDSFLLNHSTEYSIAALGSWVEFWLEYFFVPHIIEFRSVFYFGIVVSMIGQFFRVAAMWTAKSNFSHRIEYSKRKEHQLITHGVYSIFRHPSYFGWFIWSVGTQLILVNPICTVAYTIASWNFFRQRIPYEEEILLQFFPDEYPRFRSRVWSGIPFVG